MIGKDYFNHLKTEVEGLCDKPFFHLNEGTTFSVSHNNPGWLETDKTSGHQHKIIEPCHEIMAFSVLRKLNLQLCMHSHLVGPDV